MNNNRVNLKGMTLDEIKALGADRIDDIDYIDLMLYLKGILSQIGNDSVAYADKDANQTALHNNHKVAAMYMDMAVNLVSLPYRKQEKANKMKDRFGKDRFGTEIHVGDIVATDVIEDDNAEDEEGYLYAKVIDIIGDNQFAIQYTDFEYDKDHECDYLFSEDVLALSNKGRK